MFYVLYPFVTYLLALPCSMNKAELKNPALMLLTIIITVTLPEPTKQVGSNLSLEGTQFGSHEEVMVAWLSFFDFVKALLLTFCGCTCINLMFQCASNNLLSKN
jgi:hypothetical protein